ncbi:MAG: alpha/beta hydrolase fold domain-containing protein [Paludibacteraceae bacterium]|nr:alpha/beta hydrolase fold domain-containing protein [Paludibacteraceae bacterium]
MKKIFLLALSLLSLNVFAQWGGGGWDFGGGGGGGFNFGGDGSQNSGNIGDYTSKKDIDYVGDGHIGHKMDVYFPKDNNEKHNVIIHIYGSAWGSNNSKGSADLGTVGIAALQAGYILVCPNHRTYQDALYPAQINDIKAVVRYLRGNAEELGIDTSFIAISGFSSGGHLASLMGVTRNVEKEYTVGSATMDIEGTLGKYTNESSWVDAVCDWSGPVDCRDKGCGNPIPMAPENDMVGGCNDQQCPDKHALLGANTFIDATDAPTMIAHGSADNIVPQCEGEKFYNNLKKAGVECEYHPHGGQHGVEGSLTDEMITFFNKQREKKAAAATALALIQNNANKLCIDNNKVYICDGNGDNATFYLSDVSGKILFIGEITEEGLDISSLNSGLYILKSDKGSYFKFIK